MTTQSQPTENNRTQETTIKIDDPNISFGDYERARRGGVSEVKIQSAPEGKPQEQKKPVESGTAENEDENANADDDVSDESDEGSDGAESSEKGKGKKKSGFQRRIDKLNARNSAAQEELEYWKKQALKQGIESVQSQGQKVDNKPEPQGKPNADDFETHAEYVEALTDWKLEQREKAREADNAKKQLISEQEKTQQAYAERVKSFSEKVDDFNEVLAGVDDVVVSPALIEVLISSENGPEIMYGLAKDRAELERVSKLGPLTVAKEIGKLEAKIAAKSSSETKETKKITTAPKPIDPVGKGGSSSVPKKIDDPDLSFSDYERLRREQMAKRR